VSRSRDRPAARVAAGILVTRILGLVRERVFAHYFGLGLEADAFRAALKIPNIIRNLLGEGTLSASFIPVYASLIHNGQHDQARRVSGVIASLLILLAAAGGLVGIVLAPVITDAVAIGFSDEARALTTSLVRILFPMAAVMIIAAWCLGVLNTHGRFFLSYAAPTLWNIAQITTMIALGAWLTGRDLIEALAWAALAGSVIHLVVQLPATIKEGGGIRWSLDTSTPGVRKVLVAWLPVILGAGALQISSLIDTQLASLLNQGAVANLGYAQLIALLPISLFGTSVAAAALPSLSRQAADADAASLGGRVAAATRRVLYYVLPSAVAFYTLRTQIVGLILQTGAFGPEQTEAVALVLAALGLGLPATALIKLFASAHYALGDTKTPVIISAISVGVGAVLGYTLMHYLGVMGIALGGSIAAYLNVSMNYIRLKIRTRTLLTARELRGITISFGVAWLAAGVGHGVESLLPLRNPWLAAPAPLLAFAAVYLMGTRLLGHRDAKDLLDTIAPRSR
jgi:putative peptidoglycan lipid II flippase